METIELFNIGLMHIVMGNTVLSKEEQETIALLYDSYIHDTKLDMDEEELATMLSLYKITLKNLLLYTNELKKVIGVIEQKED